MKKYINIFVYLNFYVYLHIETLNLKSMATVITATFNDVEIEKDGEIYIGSISATMQVTPATWDEPSDSEVEVDSFEFFDWEENKTDKITLADCEAWVNTKSEEDFNDNEVDYFNLD